MELQFAKKDETMITEFAKQHGQTITQFLLACALEKIENEYDIQIANDYEKRKRDGELELVSHDEFWNSLNV